MADDSVLSLEVKTLPSEEDLIMAEVEIIVVLGAKVGGLVGLLLLLLI